MVAKQKMTGLNGDEASAFATKQVDPDVVAAYPITPQTIIVEKYSEYVADGLVGSEFVAVESEHSALSACVGASAAGARAFTATAANGLALMWEILFIAAGLRLPIVMAVANRCIGGPINIHNDHSDAMGARDTGWIQIFCENNQEVYDTSVEAWRIAEHPDVQMPVMVNFDGFTISHTMENVYIMEDADVKKFVGKRVFMKTEGTQGEVDFKLYPEHPITIGPLDLQDFYFEHKVQQMEAMKGTLKSIKAVDKEFEKVTGRKLEYVYPYKMEDAEVAVIGMGSMMGTVREVVDELRAEGVKAGMIKLRLFRPFPVEEILKAIGKVPVLGVMEKAYSIGGPGAPLYMEVKTALYDQPKKPLVADYINGLGGKDTSPEMIRDIFKRMQKIKEKGAVDEPVSYIGVRE
ncbi:MAG: pyruvate ferredoxin oxidoreductase [Candidatus Bathyarchaeota archaeon]|nr:pyruvate ferredoxin oxidoreductase [Candidatus Bathyarchaeota archaeon]